MNNFPWVSLSFRAKWGIFSLKNYWNCAHFPWVNFKTDGEMSNAIFIRHYQRHLNYSIYRKATMVGPEGRKFWKSSTQDPEIQAILLKGVWKIKFPEFPWIIDNLRKNSLSFPDFPWNFSKSLYFLGFPGFPGSVWTLSR